MKPNVYIIPKKSAYYRIILDSSSNAGIMDGKSGGSRRTLLTKRDAIELIIELQEAVDKLE